MEQPIWRPSPDWVQQSLLSDFMNENGGFPSYTELHRWSIECPEAFWRAIWKYCRISGDSGDVIMEHSEQMSATRWFPAARLSFTANMLRLRDNSDAIVFWGEDRVRKRLSHADLYHEVALAAAALSDAGIVADDCVAAWMPNMPETVIVMLASASLGAVFSSCSSDFGVTGAVDRFSQIQPKILVSADGYFYNGKTIDSLERLAGIRSRLDTVEKVVVVPYVSDNPNLETIPDAVSYRNFVQAPRYDGKMHFARRPFEHPLYILYSSGTMGVPKCIVHSTGGTLLQHMKEHQLHCDIKPGDRLFYLTTCGWMMWNWMVSALASGATLLLYDGSPFVRDGRILFDYAEAEAMTHFGTSPKFIASASKAGVRPAETHDLSALRVILSTGSPLSPEGFDFVYHHVKKDVLLASISGGTDIVSCFVLGCPTNPVWRGEIQCKGLGMAVDVFDEKAQSVREQQGELVCTRPFPSMPLGFLNDRDGAKFSAAYFEKFSGVWAHGDLAEITSNDGIIIHGRSDSVLNPGGVRIGTAEIYRQVEQLSEIQESLVIGQEWCADVRIVLFVRLRQGLALDEPLMARIRQIIRDSTTPRHVPAKIIAVPDIPRTRSGKNAELAVRDVVHGRTVKNVESLENPEALVHFKNLQELAN